MAPGLAAVCERYDEFIGQDRRAEEALVEVLVEPVRADDGPPSTGVADLAFGGQQAFVADLFGVHGGKQDQPLDAGRAGGTENQNSHQSITTDLTDNPGTTVAAGASYRPSDPARNTRE